MEECGFTDARNVAFKLKIGIKENTQVPNCRQRLDRAAINCYTILFILHKYFCETCKVAQPCTV